MWGVEEFFGKVLSCPMFIMLSVFPKSGMGEIINYSLISYPNLGLILPVAKGKLLLGVGFHLHHFKLRIDPSFRYFTGLGHLIILVTARDDTGPVVLSAFMLGDFHPPLVTSFTFVKD